MALKVAYLTTYDVHDRRAWAKCNMGLWGAGSQIAKHLTSNEVSLEYLGPLMPSNGISLGRIGRSVRSRFYSRLTNKRYLSDIESSRARDYANQLNKKLAASDADIALCPENALVAAYVRCRQPVVLWTDAPIGAQIDSYPYLSNLCAHTIRQIHAIEKAALENCKLTIYASEWAAHSAAALYGADKSKTRVLPRGGNVAPNGTRADVEQSVEARPFARCKLLLVGVDWFRKGADVAVQIAQRLHDGGLSVELTVMGCRPPTDEPLPPFVRVINFIDKTTAEGAEQFNQVMAESHFLLLPARAEAFGNVLTEANAFGVPSLASDVGGIRTAIRDGVNGMVFSRSSSAADYAAYIALLMRDPQRYRELALSSLREYETRLNWPAICATARQLLFKLCRAHDEDRAIDFVPNAIIPAWLRATYPQ